MNDNRSGGAIGSEATENLARPLGSAKDDAEHGASPRSCVRVRADPAAPATPRDELLSDQLNFTVNTLHLRRLVDFELGHPFANAARRLAADHLSELEDIRDKLEDLLSMRDPRLVEAERLLTSGSPLAAYVRGLLASCEAVVAAFEEVLCRANDERVDWPRLHGRLLVATQSRACARAHEFAHAVRVELARDRAAGAGGADPALDVLLDGLFCAASSLYERAARTGASAITESGGARRDTQATRPPKSR